MNQAHDCCESESDVSLSHDSNYMAGGFFRNQNGRVRFIGDGLEELGVKTKRALSVND